MHEYSNIKEVSDGCIATAPGREAEAQILHFPTTATALGKLEIAERRPVAPANDQAYHQARPRGAESQVGCATK